MSPGDQKPVNFSFRIPVPGLVDLAQPRLKWQNYRYFWYKREIDLAGIDNDARVFLQIEQVMFGTEVWVNGRRVGGDIPCYTRQEFDITPVISRKGNNELLVRVGQKDTLPAESAVGNDFEKISWIPGIWGDVWLQIYGAGRISWCRIIPDIEAEVARITLELENLNCQEQDFTVNLQVKEIKSGRVVGRVEPQDRRLPPNQVVELQREIPLADCQLWEPENPFLYQLQVEMVANDQLSHRDTIAFGMRRFEIREGHFYLNGNRRVLFGSNIPFHRLLSDENRKDLPWNQGWIKKVLVDIPKAHHMFFFRIHLGHAYNRWYDIADEYGIMLQDEWMFWTISGSYTQIEKEFRCWLRENCNHPSIVIWDALNECEDKEITERIIPELKKLDPTRPWESVDFTEDHPYIYSLGPVLNDSKFGYSRSIFDLANSPTPTMVSEYIWFWLDGEARPTFLTEKVLERWLGGKTVGKRKLLAHQAMLAAELTELWRRLDLDAMLPFVYLSASGGATANWFLGSLEELKPKPILKALKQAFSPLGVSLELWDRHFTAGESRNITVYLFNDTQQEARVRLQIKITGPSESTLFLQNYTLPAGEHRKIKAPCTFPKEVGGYVLMGSIETKQGKEIARSRKPVFILAKGKKPAKRNLPVTVLHERTREQEIRKLFEKYRLSYKTIGESFEGVAVIFLNQFVFEKEYEAQINRLSEFVSKGGILILQEPEFGITQQTDVQILENLALQITPRSDTEEGGYDSVVFPVNRRFRLWKGIEPEHLKFFNGGLGGEIVSAHDVHPSVPFHIAARCHLELRVPALMEIPYSEGWVIVSRIQIRGRLFPTTSSEELYARRYDPVAEQFFWNLIETYPNSPAYLSKIKREISRIRVHISCVQASDGVQVINRGTTVDVRWRSDQEESHWVRLQFAPGYFPTGMCISWSVAGGIEFQVCASTEADNWKRMLTFEGGGAGERDWKALKFENSLKVCFRETGKKWGLSEFRIFFE
ncbi:MAG: hypothetical protein Kow0042_00610 [Calditrichia bacterium]